MDFKYYHNVVNEKVIWSILSKLILLSNNIVQWEQYDYSEALFQFSVASGNESIVYFSVNNEKINKPVIRRLGIIIGTYAHSGRISKEDMQLANKLWTYLKAQAQKQNTF